MSLNEVHRRYTKVLNAVLFLECVLSKVKGNKKKKKKGVYLLTMQEVFLNAQTI